MIDVVSHLTVFVLHYQIETERVFLFGMHPIILVNYLKDVKYKGCYGDKLLLFGTPLYGTQFVVLAK